VNDNVIQSGVIIKNVCVQFQVRALSRKSGAEPVQNSAPLPAGAVIAADYDRFTERLP
jgi:hypothetical protein